MAGELKCENANDWKFVTLIEGACQTPLYIAYSTKINEALLLQKVALHNSKQQAFNVKWNKALLCPAIAYLPPSKVECVDGKPKFVYPH